MKISSLVVESGDMRTSPTFKVTFLAAISILSFYTLTADLNGIATYWIAALAAIVGVGVAGAVLAGHSESEERGRYEEGNEAMKYTIIEED